MIEGVGEFVSKMCTEQGRRVRSLEDGRRFTGRYVLDIGRFSLAHDVNGERFVDEVNYDSGLMYKEKSGRPSGAWHSSSFERIILFYRCYHEWEDAFRGLMENSPSIVDPTVLASCFRANGC